MIIQGNTVGTPVPKTNWNQTNPEKADYLKGRDDLAQLIQEAKTAGVNAQTAANNAHTAADNAQTSANNAQTSADNAQASANNAQVTADNAHTAIDTHIADKNNPHKVTCEQIGAMSITKLWKNASPLSYFPQQEIAFDEDLNKYDAFLATGTTSPDWQGMGVTVAFMEHAFHIGFGETFRNGWVHAHSISFYNAYTNGTINDELMIPYEIYGINFGNKVEEPANDNLFDINNIKLAVRNASDITNYAPKVENGVFYSGGKIGYSSGAISYVTVNAGDIIRLSANATGSGNLRVFAFATPTDTMITNSVELEGIQANNAPFEKTYTIPDGMNCFGFSAEASEKYALQLTDIVMQKIY